MTHTSFAGKSKKSTSLPIAVRSSVWSEYIGRENGKGKCYCCDKDIFQDDFECGHVISRHKGGDDKISNLRPICNKCNKSMGTQHMEEFMSKYGYNTLKKHLPPDRIDNILSDDLIGNLDNPLHVHKVTKPLPKLPIADINVDMAPNEPPSGEMLPCGDNRSLYDNDITYILSGSKIIDIINKSIEMYTNKNLNYKDIFQDLACRSENKLTLKVDVRIGKKVSDIIEYISFRKGFLFYRESLPYDLSHEDAKNKWNYLPIDCKKDWKKRAKKLLINEDTPKERLIILLRYLDLPLKNDKNLYSTLSSYIRLYKLSKTMTYSSQSEEVIDIFGLKFDVNILGTLNVTNLKDMCRLTDKKQSGPKDEIIARLLSK